jgi:hypothetical protein
VGYEVFAGNRADVTTLEEIVEAMEAKYGRARRVWVLDRGLVSEEKLGFLRGRGAGYLVGTPKGMLKQFERALVERAWVEVREGVQVKLVESPEGEETFVLCRSQDRGGAGEDGPDPGRGQEKAGLQRGGAADRAVASEELAVSGRV